MHIDWWTLALQAVNFLILVWLLGRFLYRPIAEIVRQRQQAAQNLLDEADAARRQAEADRAEIARTRQGLAAEREQAAASARAKAEDDAAVVLKAAKDAAANIRRDAEAGAHRTEAIHDRMLQARAEELALAIAAKLLARLPAQDANAAFLDGLVASLKAMPAPTRNALNSGARIEIATATPLDDRAIAQLRTALESVLGGKPELSFRTDPGVIAGIELTSEDVSVRNSWRADLARIQEELARDGG